MKTTIESSSKSIQEIQIQHSKELKTQSEKNKSDLLKDNTNKSLAIKKEIKTSETRIIQELGKLFGRTTDPRNLIIKLFEENKNDQNIIKNIQKLCEQINRAMINYDAEFKILIINQKIQIAAETSDIFKDIFGRINLTLSRKSADFQTEIDRFKMVGMEMINLMLDLNEIVNNMNEKIKNSV
jgi:hypothetical protein